MIPLDPAERWMAEGLREYEATGFTSPKKWE